MENPKNTDPASEKPEEDKVPFMKTAEAKMVLYVVPVAIILLIIAYVASSCGAA